MCRTTSDDDDDPTAPSNWVVMVPYAIPGETVRVRVVENRKRHSTAELVEVTSASASEHRVSPRCRWFGVCGGCQYQHMDVASQRYWKREHVRDAFERRGATTLLTDDVLRPTLGTDDHHYGYRSKITPRRERRSNGDVVVGFSDASPRRRLLDVSECAIASDALNAALAETRGESSTTTTTGSLLLRHGDDGVVVSDPDAVLATTVRDVTFSFRAGNFFQINSHALDSLVDAVGDAATAPLGGSGGRSPTTLVDCYCGSGLFSVSLADRFDACVGVEVGEAAVREARANAAANGARNCSFRAADAERLFATARSRDVSPDDAVVVVDPPRRGCSDRFLRQLSDFAPARVVYLSCDPVTQARDARTIIAAANQGRRHRYELTAVTPIDLFPQTKHVECLAVFERR